ncbi:MAG: hypothetical protein ACPG4U_01450 [Pseudomonadales bacterium]
MLKNIISYTPLCQLTAAITLTASIAITPSAHAAEEVILAHAMSKSTFSAQWLTSFSAS